MDSIVGSLRYKKNMKLAENNIRVDEFTSGGAAYFLSHFHGDHMRGLRKGWATGPLYCSGETAKLLTALSGVESDSIHVIEKNEPFDVKFGRRKVTVTAVDANHCPGAVMFLFEGRNISDGGRKTDRVLYTGDFRLNREIAEFAENLNGVDVAYVDSTFAEPIFRFPSQEEVIEEIVELVAEEPDIGIFLALYTIGKNRIVSALYRRFKRPVYVSDRIHKAYVALGLGKQVTREKDTTNFFGFGRGYYMKYFPHKKYPGKKKIIIPTGWAADRSQHRRGMIFLPYSEHCSYDEYNEFINLLDSRKVVKI